MHISLQSLFVIALSAATMVTADTSPNALPSIPSPPSQLPVCGLSCADKTAKQTACQTLLNVTCQCMNQEYANLMNTCINTNCKTPKDRNDTITIGKAFCKAQGSQASGGTNTGDAGSGSPTNADNPQVPTTAGPTTPGATTNQKSPPESTQGTSGSGASGNASGTVTTPSASAKASASFTLVASLGAVAIAFATLV